MKYVLNVTISQKENHKQRKNVATDKKCIFLEKWSWSSQTLNSTIYA